MRRPKIDAWLPFLYLIGVLVFIPLVLVVTELLEIELQTTYGFLMGFGVGYVFKEYLEDRKQKKRDYEETLRKEQERRKDD